jgi:hypothetical protein
MRKRQTVQNFNENGSAGGDSTEDSLLERLRELYDAIPDQPLPPELGRLASRLEQELEKRNRSENGGR